jgi:hypothetical protein
VTVRQVTGVTFAGIGPGKTWLEMSSTDAAEIGRLAALVEMRGADAVDCPVSAACIAPQPVTSRSSRDAGAACSSACCRFYETVCSALSDPGAKNPRLEFHDVLVDGELYTCRFTMSGTHTGTFMGVPATNRPYSISGITIMRFAADGERVIECFSQADMPGLLVQIGAVPAPG